MKFGKRIKDFRTAMRWNQMVLSEKTGISQSRISRIESSKAPANINEISLFAKAFEVTESELFDVKIKIRAKIEKKERRKSNGSKTAAK